MLLCYYVFKYLGEDKYTKMYSGSNPQYLLKPQGDALVAQINVGSAIKFNLNLISEQFLILFNLLNTTMKE